MVQVNFFYSSLKISKKKQVIFLQISIFEENIAQEDQDTESKISDSKSCDYVFDLALDTPSTSNTQTTEKVQEENCTELNKKHDDTSEVENTEEKFPAPTKNDYTAFTDENFTSLLGKFSSILDDLKENQALFDKYCALDIIEEKAATVEIIDSISSLKEHCNLLIEVGNEVLKKFNKNDLNISIDDTVTPVEIVNHDPGLRPQSISNNQRKYLIELGPHQPCLALFPSDGKNRFNAQWYKEFKYLEYSTVKDAAYCFVCYLFPVGVGSGREKSDNAWIEVGVKTWGKMKSAGKQKLGKLQQHFSSVAHKAALRNYCDFLIQERHIDVLLDKNKRLALIEEEKIQIQNRKVLEILMDTIRTLGTLGLGFRHSETTEKGNFGQIIGLISRHNNTLDKWFQDRKLRPYQVTYMSGESQNEMISLIGSEVRASIVKEIKASLFFSLMADTTPDLSHKDILSIVIRYADMEGNIYERLVKTTECCDKSGQGMTDLLIKCLRELGLDTAKLAFQSYDFASNMSGRFNGVQKKITDALGYTVPYIPCQDHRTNTALEHACNVSTLVRDFFNITEELYVFFTSSTKRFKHLQQKIQGIDKAVQLKNLSRTRWTAKSDSVKALNQSLEEIIELLTEISRNKEFDCSTRTKALGLYKKTSSLDFIVLLFFLKNILPKIKILTETIESPKLNIIDCINIIKVTAQNLNLISTNSKSLDDLIQSAIQFAENIGIDAKTDFLRHHRRRLLPKAIDENNDNAVKLDLNTFYRKEFIEILNTLNSALIENFQNIEKTIGPTYEIFKFPLDKKNITLRDVEKVVEMFPPGAQKPDIHLLQSEIEVLFDLSSHALNFPQLFTQAKKLKVSLPEAFRFCLFVLTIPYGVSTNERSFSQLKLVKNALRTLMSDEKLDNLMLLRCEEDVAKDVDLSNVIKCWSILKKRRISL